MHEKLSSLDILAIVTLKMINGCQQIVPAIESTTDLWFECVARVDGGSRTHFIASSNFEEFCGISWGNFEDTPTGVMTVKLNPVSFETISNMKPEKIKKQFEEALPTSTLMTQLGH